MAGQREHVPYGALIGVYFNGVPEATGYSKWYRLYVTGSGTDTTYGYTALPGAPLMHVVVNHTGVAQRLVWEVSSRAWIPLFTGPNGECDNYARCGPFGLCNPSTPSSRCGCVPGFSPKSSSSSLKFAEGCGRDVDLDCLTDSFKVVPGVKLPGTHNSSVDTGITLEECKARCKANYSCLAYAAAYIYTRRR